MNIYQKLIEVRKSVPFLKKDEKNPVFGFKFVSSSQVLGAIRAAMDEQGLFLRFTVKSHKVQDHQTSKGGHQYMSILGIEFTWVDAADPSQTITSEVFGYGLDEGEKGIGKALTYAEKYFLLKFFNVPTDKDDPDASRGEPGPKKERYSDPTWAEEQKKKDLKKPPKTKDKKEPGTGLPPGTTKIDPNTQEVVLQAIKKLEEDGLELDLVREYMCAQGKIKLKDGVPQLDTMTPDFAEKLLKEENSKLFKEAFAKWCIANADKLEGTAQEERE